MPLNGEYGALAVPVVGNSVRVTTVPLVPMSELTLLLLCGGVRVMMMMRGGCAGDDDDEGWLCG